MLNGYPPYDHNNQSILFTLIRKGSFKLSSSIPETARSIIIALLNVNPEKRLGYDSIDQVKNHAFFQEVDWKKMLKRQVPAPIKPEIKDGFNSSRGIGYNPTPDNKYMQGVIAVTDFTYTDNMEASIRRESYSKYDFSKH